MSDQRVLAKEFETIAALLEISGANAFRVNATKKVSRVLQDFEGDLHAIAATPGGLEALDGIGKSSAEKIRQWCDAGTIDELETLRSEIPPGLIGLLDISGLGPKTVGRLWRETDIVDRAGLARGIEDGTLAALPRMGAKTIANIKDSLEFAEQAAERTSIGVALPLAELLLSEPRIASTAIRVLDGGRLRSLKRYSPLAEALQQRAVPSWAVALIVPQRARGDAAAKGKRLLLG